MPFNGSGTFTPAVTFADNTQATAEDQNTQDSDIASGLTQCMTRAGLSPATANWNMGGFKLTGLGTGSSSADSVSYGQISFLLQIAANTLLGNNTGSPAAPAPLTQAQILAFIGNFTSSAAGLVQASGGGLNLLRADGNFATVGQGQGRLGMTSTTVVTFSPSNGDLIIIAGQLYAIPAAGVAATINNCFIDGVASQTLSATTLYYVYLFNNSGTLALDFSTTGHSTDTTAGNVGIEIKTGDSSRSLVGMVYANSGPVFASMQVLSWFNRRSISITNHFTTARSVSSSSFAEINAEIECDFLTWAGEAVTAAANGTVENSGGSGATLSTAIAFDSTTAPGEAYTQATITGSGTPASGMGMSIAQSGLSEGFHFATLLGAASTSTATWPGSSSPGSRTTLNIGVRG